MRCVRCGAALTSTWIRAAGDSTLSTALEASPSRCPRCLDEIAAAVDRVADRLIPIVLMQMWAEA